MIGQVKEGVFVILSAPSGCGKTTIKNRLMQMGEFVFSVSYTTRDPRAGEENGKDYYFVSPEQFETKIVDQGFVEYAHVHGCYYGTGLESLDPLKEGRTVLFDIDVQGHAQVKQRYPESVSIFVLPPSWSLLKERLRSRQTESEDALDQRLRNAQQEMQHCHEYDYVVVNGDLEKVLQKIEAVVTAEYQKTKRWEIDIDAFYKS